MTVSISFRVIYSSCEEVNNDIDDVDMTETDTREKSSDDTQEDKEVIYTP